MAWTRKHVGRDGVTTWHVQWRDPDTGERRSETLGAVDEATALATATEYAETKERRQRKALTVESSEALDRFLDSRRFLRRSAGTIRYYEGVLGDLFAFMGSKPMPRWTRSDFHRYMAAKATKWEPRRIQMCVVGFRTFHGWATTKAQPPLTVVDVTEGFDAPEVEAKESESYTPEESARLLEAAQSHPFLARPVALGLLAGFDHGSIQALLWEDVHVQKAGPWTIVGVRPKTGQPRAIPVLPQLQAILSPRATSGLVCRDMPEESKLRKALHALQVKAKVPTSGWHRLRHSCLSLVGAMSKDYAVVAAIACHAPGSSMTGRYLHADPARKIAGMEAMAEALRRATQA